MSSRNCRLIELRWDRVDATYYVIDGGRANALEFDPQMTRRFFGLASIDPEFAKGSVIGSHSGTTLTHCPIQYCSPLGTSATDLLSKAFNTVY
jgi:hypothetical protein